MKIHALVVVALAVLPQISLAGTVPVQIENANGSDVYVTVRDLNQSGNPVVADQQRVNANQSIPVQVQLDGGDKYHLSWHGVQTDDPSKQKDDECAGSSADPCRIDLFH